MKEENKKPLDFATLIAVICNNVISCYILSKKKTNKCDKITLDTFKSFVRLATLFENLKIRYKSMFLDNILLCKSYFFR